MDLKVLAIILVVLLALTLHCDGNKKKPRRTKRNHATCRPNTMVRPHAQWSTLVGRTHGPEFEMWVEGRNASTGVRLFAEVGDMSQLDSASTQGYMQVLDSFKAPPIPQSVGQTSAIIFLDGRHSRVSFMMKIVPSPDWFIGVSGLDLCANGRWKDHVEVDLHPMDSGTDRGLTFTSPNWPNDPFEPISVITSSFPDHPASSFRYPEYEELPRIAYVELDIASEYRHRQDFLQIPENTYPNGSKHEHQINEHHTTDREPLGSETDAEAKEKKLILPSTLFNSQFEVKKADVDRQAPVTDASQPDNNDSTPGVLTSKIHLEDGLHTSTPNARKTTEAAGSTEKHLPNFFDLGLGRMRRPSESRRVTHPIGGREDRSDVEDVVNCEVAEWAPWNPCSVTCGFGVHERRREVRKIPKNGGGNCPLLREEAVCGSMRTCKWNHFSLFENVTKKPVRESRLRRASLE